MRELLIIKSGQEYLHFTEEGFTCCPLNKASVFPLGQIEEARSRCRQLSAAGMSNQLMKLIIHEEPYGE